MESVKQTGADVGIDRRCGEYSIVALHVHLKIWHSNFLHMFRFSGRELVQITLKRRSYCQGISTGLRVVRDPPNMNHNSAKN